METIAADNKVAFQRLLCAVLNEGNGRGASIGAVNLNIDNHRFFVMTSLMY
ncbi:hypothetical protein C4J90_2755 [Pseudomonas sp. R2-60-08W]|nr:hypothetical protein C4J90_2755 [Pseudomonas sp. R2-60-08W]